MRILLPLIAIVLVAGCTTTRIIRQPVDLSVARQVVAEHEGHLHEVRVSQIHALSAGEVGVRGVMQGWNGTSRSDVREFVSQWDSMKSGRRTVDTSTVVSQGQTLHSILRRRYGYIDSYLIAQVMRLNPSLKSPSQLRAGQRLVMP